MSVDRPDLPYFDGDRLDATNQWGDSHGTVDSLSPWLLNTDSKPNTKLSGETDWQSFARPAGSEVWISKVLDAKESGRFGAFQVTRVDTTAEELIEYSVGRDSAAIPNLDYRPLTQRIYFAAGQATAEVQVEAYDDLFQESTETIDVGLMRSTIASSLRIDRTQRSLRILDNDAASTLAIVSIISTTPAQESTIARDRNGTITFTRSGNLAKPLKFAYVVSSDQSAEPGIDFRIAATRQSPSTWLGEAEFPPNQSTLVLQIEAIDDAMIEGVEWFSIQVATGAATSYVADTKNAWFMTIVDDDQTAKLPELREVRLANPKSISDLRTASAPVIVGEFDPGVFKSGTIQFDHDGDQVADGEVAFRDGWNEIRYDLRSDPKFKTASGFVDLRYRSRFALTGSEQYSAWKSFGFFVQSKPISAAQIEIGLLVDTGNPTDLSTSDPRIAVRRLGDPQADSVRVEFDHNRDGVSDGEVMLVAGASLAPYDPRSVDTNWPKSEARIDLSFRISTAQLATSESAVWRNFQFFQEQSRTSDLQFGPSDLRYPFPGKSILSLDGSILRSDGQPFRGSGTRTRPASLNGSTAVEMEPGTAGGVLLEGCESELPTTLELSANQWAGDDVVEIEVDLDGDGTPEDSTVIDSVGRFAIFLDFERVANRQVAIRIKQRSPDRSDPKFSPWKWMEIREEASSAKVVQDLYLLNDTGENRSDRVTSLLGFRGQVGEWSTDKDLGQIRWYLEGSVNLAGTVAIDSDGGFGIDQDQILLAAQQKGLTVEYGPMRLAVQADLFSLDRNRWELSPSKSIDFRFDAPALPGILEFRQSDTPTVPGRLEFFGAVDREVIGTTMIEWCEVDDQSRVHTSPVNTDRSFQFDYSGRLLASSTILLRVVSTDRLNGKRLQGEWTPKSISQLVESQRIIPAIKSIDFPDRDLGTNDSIALIRTPSVSVRAADVPATGLDLELILDGDHSTRRTSWIPAEGKIDLHFDGLPEGKHLLQVRTIYYDLESRTLKRSEWETAQFQFERLPMVRPRIVSLGLQNDSGVLGDGITEDPTIIGSLDTASPSTLIEIDENSDQSVDAIVVASDSQRFVYRMQAAVFGENRLQVRALDWDQEQASYVRSEWVGLRFVRADQVDRAPQIVSLNASLVHSSVGDRQIEVTGTVTFQHATEGLVAELDLDGDNVAESRTYVDPYGAFHWKMAWNTTSVPTPRIRVGDESLNTAVPRSNWSSTVVIDRTKQSSPPRISSIELVRDDGEKSNDRKTSDPRIRGVVENLGPSGTLIVEVDVNSDRIVDRQFAVQASGVWEFVDSTAQPGKNTLAFRLKDLDASPVGVHRDWIPFGFDLLAPDQGSESSKNTTQAGITLAQFAEIRKLQDQSLALAEKSRIENLQAGADARRNRDNQFDVLDRRQLDDQEKANAQFGQDLDAARQDLIGNQGQPADFVLEFDFKPIRWPAAPPHADFVIPADRDQPQVPFDVPVEHGPEYPLHADPILQKAIERNRTELRERSSQIRLETQQKNRDAERLFEREQMNARKNFEERQRQIETKYDRPAPVDSNTFDRIAAKYYEKTQAANRELLRLRQQLGGEFHERVTVARTALESATRTANLNFQNKVKPVRQQYEKLLIDSTATYAQVRVAWLAFVRTNHEAGKELQKDFSTARLEFDRLIAHAIRARDIQKAQGQSEFESQLVSAAGEMRRDLAQAMPERALGLFRFEAERRAELLVAKSEFERELAKAHFSKLMKQAANASAEEMRLLEVESSSRITESRLQLQAIESWNQQTGSAWTAFRQRIAEIEHNQRLAQENAKLAKQSAVAFERGDSLQRTLTGELNVKLETTDASLTRNQRELELWLGFMQENVAEEREIAILSASRELRQNRDNIGADLERSLKDAEAAYEYGVSIAEAWNTRVYELADARMLRFGRNRVRGGQADGGASGGGASPGGGGTGGTGSGGLGPGGGNGNPTNPGGTGSNPSPGSGGSGTGGPSSGSPSDDSTSAGNGGSGSEPSAGGGGGGSSDSPSGGGTGPGSNIGSGGGGTGGGSSGGSGGNPRPGVRFSGGFEDTWEEISPTAFAEIWLRSQQSINRANIQLQNRNHDAQQVWHDAVQDLDRDREVATRELANREVRNKAAAQARFDLGIADAKRVWEQKNNELISNQEILMINAESALKRVEILQEISESRQLTEANEVKDRSCELARAEFRVAEATRYRDQLRGWANALQSAWSALQYQNAEAQLRLSRSILETAEDRTREQQRVNLENHRQLSDAHRSERLRQADELSKKRTKDAQSRASYRSSQIDNTYELVSKRLVFQRNRTQKLSNHQFEKLMQDIQRNDEYQSETLRLSRELQTNRGELWFAFTSSLAVLKANVDASEGNLRESHRLGMITTADFQFRSQQIQANFRSELDRLSGEFNRGAFGLWDRYRTVFAESLANRAEVESNLTIQREVEHFAIVSEIDRQTIAAQIQKAMRDRELGVQLAERRSQIAFEFDQVSLDLQSESKKEQARIENQKRLDDADISHADAIETLALNHRFQTEIQARRDQYEITLLRQDADAKRGAYHQTGDPLVGYQTMVADATIAKATRSAQLRLEDLERRYVIQRQGEIESQQSQHERIASENRTHADSVRLRSDAESILQLALTTAQAKQIERETKSDLAAAVGISILELELAAKQIDIAIESKQRIGVHSDEYAQRIARLQRETYLEQTSHWTDFTSNHIDQVEKVSQQIFSAEALRPWMMWEWLGYAYGARDGRAEWLGGKLITGSYNWYGWGRGYGWGLEAGWGESIFVPLVSIGSFRTESAALDSQFDRDRKGIERDAKLRWIESTYLSERAKAEVLHRSARELADAIDEGRQGTMAARASHERSENHAIRLESIRRFNADQEERAELSRIKLNTERYLRENGLRQVAEYGQIDIEFARMVAQAEVGYQLAIGQRNASITRSQAVLSGDPQARYQAAYADAYLLWIRQMGDAFIVRQTETVGLDVEQAIALKASQHAETNQIDRLSLERLECDQEVHRSENARKAINREEIENRLSDSKLNASGRVASVSEELELASADTSLARFYEEAESMMRLKLDQLQGREIQQAGKQHLHRLAEAKQRYSNRIAQSREEWNQRTAEAAEIATLERARIQREQRDFTSELRRHSAETELESRFSQDREVAIARRDASLERLNITAIVDKKRAQSEARYWSAEEVHRNDAHRVIDLQMNIPWTRYLVGIAARDSLLWSEQMQQYLDLAFERVELERSFSQEFVVDEYRRSIIRAEADRDRDLAENVNNRDEAIRRSRLREENEASLAVAARSFTSSMSQADFAFSVRKADLELAFHRSGDRERFNSDLRQAENQRDGQQENAEEQWYRSEGRAYTQKIEAEADVHHDHALSKMDADQQWSDKVESLNQERQQKKVDAYLRSHARDIELEITEKVRWANAKASSAVAFALNSGTAWSRRDAAVLVAGARRTAENSISFQRLASEKANLQAGLERAVFRADANDRAARTADLFDEWQKSTSIDFQYNMQRAKSIQTEVDSNAYRVSLPRVASPENGRLSGAEPLISRARVGGFALRSGFTIAANLSWKMGAANWSMFSVVTSSTVFPVLISDLWNQFQAVVTTGIQPKQDHSVAEISATSVRSLDELFANSDSIDELADAITAVVEEPQRSTQVSLQLTPKAQPLPVQEANVDEVAKILRQQGSEISEKATEAIELSTTTALRRPENKGVEGSSLNRLPSAASSEKTRFPETGESSVRRPRAWLESSVIQAGCDWDATRVATTLASFEKNPMQFLPGSEIREYLSKSLDAAKTPGMRERQAILRARELVQRDTVFVNDETMQVYWGTWISVKNRLGRERMAAVPIGSLRDHGWVYLNNGSRAMLSALKNLALRHRGATQEQIEQTLDAATSPYQIDMQSKQIGIFIGGTSMHIYGVGNVERLYNLYSGTKFYYGGVGNSVDYQAMELKGGSSLGGGAGLGWSDLIDRILDDIQKFGQPGQKVHIFGWSRGAAIANELARELGKRSVFTDFLGMFDTVYSNALPGQDSLLVDSTYRGYYGNYVEGTIDYYVRSAASFYAVNEDRTWFPATRFAILGDTRLITMKSPGAHGEIGGHFSSNMFIQRLNMRMMIDYASQNGEALFRHSGLGLDIARILSSPLTVTIATEGFEFRERAVQQWNNAVRHEMLGVIGDDYIENAFSRNDEKLWVPGGMGSQRGAINLFWFMDIAMFSLAIEAPTKPKQPFLGHVKRDLSWVRRELLESNSLAQFNSSANRRFIRGFYSRSVERDEFGGWR